MHLFTEMEVAAAKTRAFSKPKRHGNSLGMYMYNLMPAFGSPDTKLETVDVVAAVRLDRERNCIKAFTSLYEWEFDALVEKLGPLIARTRSGTGKPRRCKLDTANRLFWCLHWLVCGDTFKQEEFTAGWGKSSLNEDLPHVLRAIIRVWKHGLTL
ncbi:hypothetical protein B484DRAFT_468339 [Ochromonadaceae sp. CCMP2298]|nr:hypothetical protein B484DRAFT_468339 [Ochromonadaceae sp. CCMP2298]